MVIDFHLHLAPHDQLEPLPAVFCVRFSTARGDWEAQLGPKRLDIHRDAEWVDYGVGLAERSPWRPG